MRLFASIRPPEEVREHLVTALRPIRDAHGPLLRWTDPDQWHLTVAFYGEQPDGAVDELADRLRLAATATGPLDLRLRGAGSFSGRTLWIGVGGDTTELRRLMADCGDDDDPRERRRAHLTVARTRARESGGRGDDRRGGHRRQAAVGDGRRRSGRAGGPAYGGRPARRDGSRPAGHGDPDMLGDLVRALSVYGGPEWRATEIELVSSLLGEGRSGGALHEVVARVPLTG